MSLPNDINMLVSILNMKLRDDDMSLNTILETYDEDYETIISKLETNGFIYDSKSNQIKAK